MSQVRFGLAAPEKGLSLWAEPSLAASALRSCGDLAARFEGSRDVVLVAPERCGFDTLCAMYLVRRILEGRPMRGRLSLLASYATAERRGYTIRCPLAERLSSVVLAARRRGRNFSIDGLNRLFEDASRRIEERSLNPLYDSVLAGLEEWRPELELLRRDHEEYQGDRARGIRELMLCGASGSFDVMEALLVSEPRSILTAQWAWHDAEGSVEGRGFPVCVLHAGGQHGVAVAPGVGSFPSLTQLARMLNEVDAQGGWSLLNHDGVDGEFGETGVWSTGRQSRLDGSALRELIRAQWVEASITGPIRVLDCPREANRPAKDWVEMSTGRVLAGCAPGASEGHYRVVRVPLRPEAGKPLRPALEWHLCELLLPLVESRPVTAPAQRYDAAEGHLLVSGDHGVAVAHTTGGDDLVNRVQKAVANLSVLSADADRLSTEPLEADGRKAMLESFVALRSAIAVSGLRGVERFLAETGQETAFEAQRRVWETQLLHREAAAMRATLAKVEQLQAKLDYLGVFAIAAAVIAAVEFLAKPLVIAPEGRVLLAFAATLVFLAAVSLLLGRARPNVHRWLAVPATAVFAVLWFTLSVIKS